MSASDKDTPPEPSRLRSVRLQQGRGGRAQIATSRQEPGSARWALAPGTVHQTGLPGGHNFGGNADAVIGSILGGNKA